VIVGGGMTVKFEPLVWMTAVILSHIFVLGYGWFFVDALVVMLLAAIYLLLTRRLSHWGEPESMVRIPAKANTDSGGNANGIPGRRRTVLGA
jgi:chromate transport protein ChrA